MKFRVPGQEKNLIVSYLKKLLNTKKYTPITVHDDNTEQSWCLWGRMEVREQAMASLPLWLFLASCDPGAFSQSTGLSHQQTWGQRTDRFLCSSQGDNRTDSIKQHDLPWLAEGASHSTAKERQQMGALVRQGDGSGKMAPTLKPGVRCLSL